MPPPPRWPYNALSARDVIVVAGLALLLFFFGGASLIANLRQAGVSFPVLHIAGAAAVTLSLLLPIYFYLIAAGRCRPADLGIVLPDAFWARLGAASGVALVVVAIGVSVFVDVDPPDAPKAPAGDLPVWLRTATLLVYVGLLAPVAEELFFRGVLFNWMRSRLDFAPAALASALAFGLLHLASLPATVFYVIVGGLTAWLFERSQSLVPAMLAHGTFNTIWALMVVFFSGGATGG